MLKLFRTNHSRSVYLTVGSVLVLACSATQAQPVRAVDGGVMVTVPYEVHYHNAEYRSELKTIEVGPIPAGRVPAALPMRVPVITLGEDGKARRGMFLRNRAGSPPAPISSWYPSAVVFDKDAGKYDLSSGVVQTEDDRPPYTAELEYRGLAYLEVYYDGPPVAPPAGTNGAWDVVWITDQLPAGVLASLQPVLTRVQGRFQTILRQSSNRGVVRITLTYEALGPGIVAQTVALRTPQIYPDASTGLYEQALADGESDDAAIYEWFPLGLGIQGTFDAGTRTANIILVNNAAHSQMGLAYTPAADDATIRINSDLTLDFDAVDGVGANSFDIENALTHELIHVLGFSSRVDSQGTDPVPTMTLLDLFRFIGVGSTISADDFLTRSRMLQTGIPAITPTRFSDSARTYRMSTGEAGDGSGAGHWKLRPPYIGIMDPGQAAGEAPPTPGYLFESDLRALDTIGWNLNFPFPALIPIGVVPTSPPDGSEVASLTPTLQWGSATGSLSRGVFVYRGDSTNDEDRVFAARDLSPTILSQVIPAGVLSPGQTYTWFVTSINDYAFTYSAKRSFSTPGFCTADLNMDGVVDFNDYLEFLNLFDAMDPRADLTGDSVVDFNDYLEFLNHFDAGC